MEGYVAAKTFVEGVRRAGAEATPRGIQAGLESLREFDMGGFRLGFERGRHTGSRFVDLTILTDEGKTRY